MATSTAQSPPYIPTYQNLGGTPTPIPDIPICGVFILLYFIAGLAHQKLVIGASKSGRKFAFCGMMAGLSWIRIVTCVLRIVWSCKQTNIRVGIAAQIFTNIGTVLLYFVNLFFCQRIVRAQHPRFGWSKLFSPIIPILCLITVLTVISVIVASIQSFYTLSTRTRSIDATVQLVVETVFAAMAFIPFLIVLVSTLMRQVPAIKKKRTMDKFGTGRFRTKVIMLLGTSALLSLADSLKAGTSYYYGEPALTATQPWYYNRGIFYGFGFAPEVIILYLYAIMRVDQRFFVPNGAKGPYTYAGGFTFAGESGNEKHNLGQRDSTRHLTGSSPSIAMSLGESSVRSSRRRSRSTSRQSFVSWGGINHVGEEPVSVGEDGAPAMPHLHFDDSGDLGLPASIPGVDNEMGWDSRSGKWVVRPVSYYTRSNAGSVGEFEHV